VAAVDAPKLTTHIKQGVDVPPQVKAAVGVPVDGATSQDIIVVM
jgi:hypothetical protein